MPFPDVTLCPSCEADHTICHGVVDHYDQKSAGGEIILQGTGLHVPVSKVRQTSANTLLFSFRSSSKEWEECIARFHLFSEISRLVCPKLRFSKYVYNVLMYISNHARPSIAIKDTVRKMYSKTFQWSFSYFEECTRINVSFLCFSMQ